MTVDGLALDDAGGGPQGGLWGGATERVIEGRAERGRLPRRGG